MFEVSVGAGLSMFDSTKRQKGERLVNKKSMNFCKTNKYALIQNIKLRSTVFLSSIK